MSDIHTILKTYWGYDSFRPLQQDVIETVISRTDCLALMPTGGGKSICFQVPTLARDGICLVISPLIALMKDQVESLRRKGITAFHIHSGMARKDVASTLQLAAHSNCRFLYVSPERLETTLFREYLPSLGVSLIAVDEAHCISQWGYDFRPAYLKIAQLRDDLPDVPVLALTASATAQVQEDICKKLLFRKHRIFRQSFHRPNISYSCFEVPSKINKVVDILSKVDGCAIVYCSSRRRTREISGLLNMNGITADFYHAGLTAQERSSRQDAWLTDRVRVIVSTNAFGMGIDKPNVRVVIHVDPPDSLESYYQEAGRAGRDGRRSYAVLLFSRKDLRELNGLPALRYPALDRMRTVYQSLMNHLQIAAGCGEGQSYDLDTQQFFREFKLEAQEVFPILKTLEQEGLMYFTEQVFAPAKLQVTANRQTLEEYEKKDVNGEALLKALLRTYEGILDMPVNIYEQAIARTLNTNAGATSARLRELHRLGLVVYEPQKEKPQVCLLQNRVAAQDLRIDMKRHQERKKLYEHRLAAMTGYLQTESECRSVIIGKYFGDAAITECGICDCCLRKKKQQLTQKEFERTHERLVNLVSERPLSVSEILVRDKGLSRETLMEVIRFLQGENKVTVTEDGAVSLH